MCALIVDFSTGITQHAVQFTASDFVRQSGNHCLNLEHLCQKASLISICCEESQTDAVPFYWSSWTASFSFITLMDKCVDGFCAQPIQSSSAHVQALLFKTIISSDDISHSLHSELTSVS